MRIFVTGAEGQVARSLREAAAGDAGLVLGWGSRPAFDLTRPDTVARAIEAFEPDLVVNPAAYTAVDKAESEPELAFRINAEAPGVMAQEAKALGAAMVHFSTDYVFPGTLPEAQVEDDATGHINVYG